MYILTPPEIEIYFLNFTKVYIHLSNSDPAIRYKQQNCHGKLSDRIAYATLSGFSRLRLFELSDRLVVQILFKVD
ncbi:MAG: hypothetical protein AB1861_16395 [Cyanobacteriota bacterium]